MAYTPSKIEPKWQKYWAKNPELSRASDESKKKKFYCLCMFPYPSGEGLHVGHVESYTATDIVARYKRMQGFNVLYPMGWDAFGLPAENYAIKNGKHPAKTTAESIKVFKKQMGSLGLSYDWDRELNSSQSDYYKWTQWFFIFLWKRGLAYKKKAKVNWCPKCQTSLANEQVISGRCERCESEVNQKELEQWFFRITDYAEKLLQGLENLDWPQSVKDLQKNWIGKSNGAEIVFEIKKINPKDKKYFDQKTYSNIEIASNLKRYPTVARVKVFTTRPDTLFGATYLALAPDGKFVEEVKEYIANFAKIKAYQISASAKSELQRTSLDKKKTGVEIQGLIAVNPANNQPLPIWVADYIMGDYGSGAIMAVPAHDQRDFEFAFKNKLPVERVIYEQGKHLAFLPMSFLQNPKEILENLKNNFELNFLNLNKVGFTISSDLKVGIPYGIFTHIKGENEIEKYIKIIQGDLKKNRWSEIVGGKYFSYVFGDKIIKDDLRENVEELQTRLKKSVEILLRRKTEDPRLPLLEKVANSKNFSPEFLNWTLPVGFYREAICVSSKEGYLWNSAFLDGMGVERASDRITDWLAEQKIGQRTVNYRLRDWLVSRQRYWGAPIPMVYCEKCGIVPVPEKELPVRLPAKAEFVPTGESPLKRDEKFINTKCPKCDADAKREVDTMDTFVCSSWYFFRYTDPKNEKEFASQEKIRRFMPVDLYVGGIEHAVLHLLYTRFFTKVLEDAGYVDFSEPFEKLRNQGMILGPDHNKMSKSKGNVINPDDIVREMGADTLRLYEMFMGPLEEMKPWDTKGIVGLRRFLEKVWSLQEKVEKLSELEGQGPPSSEGYGGRGEKMEAKKMLHLTIKKVSSDIESLSFNTAISQMMILTNKLQAEEKIDQKDYEIFLKILSPFAPHITEELWELMGNKESIFKEEWPIPLETFLKQEKTLLVVQINGKKRESVSLPIEITEEEVCKIVLELPRLKPLLQGKKIKKWIYIPGRILNIVV